MVVLLQAIANGLMASGYVLTGFKVEGWRYKYEWMRFCFLDYIDRTRLLSPIEMSICRAQWPKLARQCDRGILTRKELARKFRAEVNAFDFAAVV